MTSDNAIRILCGPAAIGVMLTLAAHATAQDFGITRDANGNLVGRMEVLKPKSERTRTDLGEIVNISLGSISYKSKGDTIQSAELEDSTAILDFRKKKISVGDLKVGDTVRVTMLVQAMQAGKGQTVYMFETKTIQLIKSAAAK